MHLMKCPIEMCNRHYNPDDENCVVYLEGGSTMGVCEEHAIAVYWCQGCKKWGFPNGGGLLCEDCVKKGGRVRFCDNCGLSFGSLFYNPNEFGACYNCCKELFGYSPSYWV